MHTFRYPDNDSLLFVQNIKIYMVYFTCYLSNALFVTTASSVTVSISTSDVTIEETSTSQIQVCAELVGFMATEVDVTVVFEPQDDVAGKN